MKKFTKLLGIVLIIALVMSMGAAALAVDNTITLSLDTSNTDAADENVKSEIYTAYKIFDVIKAASVTDPVTTDSSIAAQTPAEGETYTAPTGFNYTISTNSKWYTVVTTYLGDYITLTDIAGDATTKTVSLKSGVANSEATAKAIAAILNAHVPEGLVENTDYWVMAKDTANIPDAITVPAGYYMITSSLGTNLIAATTNIQITEKNTYPSIDKSQKDEDDGTTYTDSSALVVQVGDTIDYQVVVYVPASASGDITVKDTMSTGLTPAAASTIVAKSYTEYDSSSNAVSGTEGTLTATTDWSAADGTTPVTYEITIHPTAATLGKYIQFTFSAVVNEASVQMLDADRKNDVELTYSNYTQTDTVPYTLYRTGVIKYDGTTGEVDDTTNELTAASGKTLTYLATAEFDLYEIAGSTETKIDLVEVKDGDTLLYYRPATATEKAATGFKSAKITSVNNATGVVIRGLDSEETYVLRETKAPDGYNLPSGDFTLTLEADSSEAGTVDVAELAKIKVPNLSGTLLPSTGGIGTTIFYVVGSILVVAAGVLLITKKRMSREG